jgi:hypothetical protein
MSFESEYLFKFEFLFLMTIGYESRDQMVFYEIQKLEITISPECAFSVILLYFSAIVEEILKGKHRSMVS